MPAHRERRLQSMPMAIRSATGRSISRKPRSIAPSVFRPRRSTRIGRSSSAFTILSPGRPLRSGWQTISGSFRSASNPLSCCRPRALAGSSSMLLIDVGHGVGQLLAAMLAEVVRSEIRALGDRLQHLVDALVSGVDDPPFTVFLLLIFVTIERGADRGDAAAEVHRRVGQVPGADRFGLRQDIDLGMMAGMLAHELRVEGVRDHLEIFLAALELDVIASADQLRRDVLVEQVAQLGDVGGVDAAEIGVLHALDRLDVLQDLHIARKLFDIDGHDFLLLLYPQRRSTNDLAFRAASAAALASPESAWTLVGP